MTKRLNDKTRSEWVDNDEGLYHWRRSTGLSMRAFIRENREELDACILRVLNGEKQAHYLAYGG
jgi:hypothetical protein